MQAEGYQQERQESIFCDADELYEEVKGWLDDGGVAKQLQEAELERQLWSKGMELLRRLMQSHVTLRCQQEPIEAVVDENGKQLTHVRRNSKRMVMTRFGLIELQRDGYGHRRVRSLYPVDTQLQIAPERYSLEVRRQCAMKAAGRSYDASVEDLDKSTGAHVPKRQFEQEVIRAAQDFDVYYAQTQVDVQPEQTSEVLVLSFDGKGIVMRYDSLRAGTQRAAKRSEHALSTRLSKGEKSNRKRMAEVAAVYTIGRNVRTAEQVVQSLRGEKSDSSEPSQQDKPLVQSLRGEKSDSSKPSQQDKPLWHRPEHKRVWASVDKDMNHVIAQAFDEAQTRTQGQSKAWVVLVDGARTQLRAVSKQADKFGVSPIVIIDIVHVIEYLWKAAHAFYPPNSKSQSERADKWVFKQLSRVLQGETSGVAAAMTRSSTLRKLSRARKAKIATTAKYLLNNKQYLHYDQYLAQGLPIATGVIEGACRHLIADRMDITGARWSLQGAEAILRLRSLVSSGDFDEYWLFHERQEYERHHLARYANRTPPRLATPPRSHHIRLAA